jgi:hypothetical protein
VHFPEEKALEIKSFSTAINQLLALKCKSTFFAGKRNSSPSIQSIEYLKKYFCLKIKSLATHR